MIKAHFYRNREGRIYAFEIIDHGQDIVCAAVSALAINTVNSIEAFSDTDFQCDYEQEGGYLKLTVPVLQEGGESSVAQLFLDSLYLGVNGIKEQYGESVSIIDEEVR